MAKLAEQIKIITKGLRVQALEPKPALASLDDIADKVAALEAEVDGLRSELKSMLDVFDDGLPRFSERKRICDRARRALGREADGS